MLSKTDIDILGMYLKNIGGDSLNLQKHIEYSMFNMQAD